MAFLGYGHEQTISRQNSVDDDGLNDGYNRNLTQYNQEPKPRVCGCKLEDFYEVGCVHGCTTHVHDETCVPVDKARLEHDVCKTSSCGCKLEDFLEVCCIHEYDYQETLSELKEQTVHNISNTVSKLSSNHKDREHYRLNNTCGCKLEEFLELECVHEQDSAFMESVGIRHARDMASARTCKCKLEDFFELGCIHECEEQQSLLKLIKTLYWMFMGTGRVDDRYIEQEQKRCPGRHTHEDFNRYDVAMRSVCAGPAIRDVDEYFMSTYQLPLPKN